MNLNLPGLILSIAGVVFIYSAVKNVKPQDVIREAFKGKVAAPAEGAGTEGAAPAPPATPPAVQPFENRSGL